MKSQEQRIADAARILSSYDLSGVSQSYEDWAAKILEAADREPPKWPTDESGAELGYKPGADLSQLRAALLADPIIKAAIAVRVAWIDSGTDSGRIGRGYISALVALSDAVNEAGL